MLTFAEEIMLLTLDDRKGTFRPFPQKAMRAALAGAMLMELALADRIDTDLQSLMVVNTQPTNDQMMDEILRHLKDSPDQHPVAYWIDDIILNMENLQEQTLGQLVDKGVLKIEDQKVLWVFSWRRYPMMDNKEVKEVRSRLRELIFSKSIPDPREAVLISLVNTCNLLDTLFSEQEQVQVMPYINELSKLDLIGREVSRAVGEILLGMTSYNRDRVID